MPLTCFVSVASLKKRVGSTLTLPADIGCVRWAQTSESHHEEFYSPAAEDVESSQLLSTMFDIISCS